MNLVELVAPGHTALLTMEMQEAVVGREALLPALAEQADACGLSATVGRVCAGARGTGALGSTHPAAEPHQHERHR